MRNPEKAENQEDLNLLYTCREFVVCVKPVGVSSEEGENSLPALLCQKLGGEVYPVHRLDLNVGGVMVYARIRSAAAALSKAVQDGAMVKEYRAVVHGTPPQQGDWEDLLWKDSRQNKVFVVRRMRKGVKPARLEFTRLTAGESSLVHIRLHTGRSHQIRVQFASRGFPLVGDHKYGAKDSASAPMLFSCRVSFPWQGKLLSYEAFPDWGV